MYCAAIDSTTECIPGTRKFEEVKKIIYINCNHSAQKQILWFQSSPVISSPVISGTWHYEQMFCKVKEHSQAVNCSLVHTKLHNMLHTVGALNLRHENNNYFSRWRKIRKYLSEELQKVTHD